MTIKRRLVFRILLAVSVLGGLAFAVCLGLALSTLSTGPSANGYGLLLVAMTSLFYLVVVVVLTVIVGAIGTRVRFAVGGLALASGVVGGVAAGLYALGSLSTIEPRDQPIELNSLLLAVQGVGTQIAPDALVLAGGAVALAVGTTIARRMTTKPSAIRPTELPGRTVGAR